MNQTNSPSRTPEAAHMGLILDSSVIIAAERSRETVEQLIGRILCATEDQDAALSAIGSG